jgi:hypothetical protein
MTRPGRHLTALPTQWPAPLRSTIVLGRGHSSPVDCDHESETTGIDCDRDCRNSRHVRVYDCAVYITVGGRCNDRVLWRADTSTEWLDRPLGRLRNSRRWAAGDCPGRQLKLSAPRGLRGSSDDDVRIFGRYRRPLYGRFRPNDVRVRRAINRGSADVHHDKSHGGRHLRLSAARAALSLACPRPCGKQPTIPRGVTA